MIETSPVRASWRPIAVIGALAVYNVVRSAAIPNGAHFVTNVAMGFVVLGAGRALGSTPLELGVSRTRARHGLRLGSMTMLAIGSALGVAALLPMTRGFFEDDRVDVSFGAMLARVLIVIPVGTVLVEEVIFRGVLHGLLRRRFAGGMAAIWGSTAFGLWHLYPVWRGYDGDPDDLGRIALVAGTFVSTFAAGLAFTWLRDRSGSLIAPMLAHTATNSFPFALAWLLA